jgi:hypothetical protein
LGRSLLAACITTTGGMRAGKTRTSGFSAVSRPHAPQRICGRVADVALRSSRGPATCHFICRHGAHFRVGSSYLDGKICVKQALGGLQASDRRGRCIPRRPASTRRRALHRGRAHAATPRCNASRAVAEKCTRLA